MKPYQIATLSAALVVYSACNVSQPVSFPGGMVTAAVHLEAASHKGVLLTPEPPDGPYESVALLETLIWPTVEVDARGGMKVTGEITTEAAVRDLAETAYSLRADAVVNLRVVRESDTTAEGHVVRTVRVTGFAIRRLDVSAARSDAVDEDVTPPNPDPITPPPETSPPPPPTP